MDRLPPTVRLLAWLAVVFAVTGLAILIGAGLAVALASPSRAAPPAVVSTSGQQGNAGASTVFAYTFNLDVTTGQLIILGEARATAVPETNVTASGCASWVKRGEVDAASGHRVTMWYGVASVTSAACPVTLDGTTPATAHLWVSLAFTGQAAAVVDHNFLAGALVVGGGPGDTPSITWTTQQTNDMLVELALTSPIPSLCGTQSPSFHGGPITNLVPMDSALTLQYLEVQVLQQGVVGTAPNTTICYPSTNSWQYIFDAITSDTWSGSIHYQRHHR